MSPFVTRRYCIRGRVQGVFYRASAREVALAHGLCGWVRNLPNGAVEAEATGTVAALEAFEAWLWKGPAAAKVTDVDVAACDLTAYGGFEIRR